MVDIIKLEDLTLDDVKSRIKSLDPAFTENNLSFTRTDTIKSPNHSNATDIFIETLIINSASRYIYPLFGRTLKAILDQILSYSSDHVVSSLTDACKELTNEVERASKCATFDGDNDDTEVYRQIVTSCASCKCRLHLFITNVENFDEASYRYSTKTEFDDDNVNIHVYLSPVDLSSNHKTISPLKYIRDYVDTASSELVNLEQLITNNEASQRLLERSINYANLSDAFINKFKMFLSDLNENTQSIKPAPSFYSKYLLTIQTTRQLLNTPHNVSIVANKTNMYPGQLRDLFNTYTDASIGLNTMGNIKELRRRLDYCNYVLNHELFVGRSSSKLLEEGKMSVTYALRYFNDCELEHCSPKSYLDSSLYNLDDLLEEFEDSNLQVYLKLTEFKTLTQKALRLAILGDCYETLDKLHHKKSGYRHPDVNGNLTELFTAFEQGEITQDEIKAKIAKYTKDIDELEVLLIKLQHEFNDCLAECAKIIEGE